MFPTSHLPSTLRFAVLFIYQYTLTTFQYYGRSYEKKLFAGSKTWKLGRICIWRVSCCYGTVQTLQEITVLVAVMVGWRAAAAELNSAAGPSPAVGIQRAVVSTSPSSKLFLGDTVTFAFCNCLPWQSYSAPIDTHQSWSTRGAHEGTAAWCWPSSSFQVLTYCFINAPSIVCKAPASYMPANDWLVGILAYT